MECQNEETPKGIENFGLNDSLNSQSFKDQLLNLDLTQV